VGYSESPNFIPPFLQRPNAGIMESMRYLLLFIPALLLTAQTPAATKKVSDHKALAAAASMPQNFKESGSPTAPITMEIYTDYQCPACRNLYMTVLPSLNADFVATGKVRLLHRDFPLQMHSFSKLATRYANAAGTIGKFDVVANQIFVTQPEWEQNGNVDAAVAKVLSPADMEKVRALVKSDTHLDDSVTRDVAMGTQDQLRETPTIVIVAKGKREVISGGMPYNILKAYLDNKLKQ
jgi:protein-disulfide isomerase